MSTISQQKDTAPPEFVKMARSWLYDNDLPAEWEDAVALEFDAAIADRKIEIVRTHAEGRPADMAITTWLAQEAYMVASEGGPACPLCSFPSEGGEVHQECADHEQFIGDMLPRREAVS